MGSIVLSLKYVVKVNFDVYRSYKIKYAVYKPKIVQGYNIQMKNKSFPNNLSHEPTSHLKMFNNKLEMYKFMIEKKSYLEDEYKQQIIKECPECLI